MQLLSVYIVLVIVWAFFAAFAAHDTSIRLDHRKFAAKLFFLSPVFPLVLLYWLIVNIGKTFKIAFGKDK